MDIFITADGSHSIFSEQYGVSYHSKYGAVQETKHVFIDAGLRLKAILKSDIKILDIGFGTGLNALMTLLEAQKRNLKIQYTAVEAYPISLETAQQLNYHETLSDENVQSVFLKLHQSDWDTKTQVNDNFTLLKLNKRFENLQLSPQFDIVYFDAFAPSAQPELWTADILKIMYDSLLPDGILTTYCAKGDVKRALKSIGFKVEKLQGPPGKREMTRAIKVVS